MFSGPTDSHVEVIPEERGIRMYEVVVVGAGPTGSAAARYCAEMGISTLLVEEHATIGYPLQCAGLLSTAAFAECRVSRDPIIREIRGARINSGDEDTLTIDGGTTKAFVVDRPRLDREMATLALRAGAEMVLKTRVYGIEGNERPALRLSTPSTPITRP